MTVESASYISQLDTTLPTAADLISEGDDHLRLTKTVLKTQFPNFGTNAVTASAAELNYSVGVTSPIQPQLNTKANSASPTFTGTVVLPANTSIGSITAAEIARLAGVAFPIQGQIDAKGAIAGQTWTGTHVFPSTTTIGGLTPTIRDYLETVTSDAQAQINARAVKAGDTYSGTHDFTGAAVTVPTATAGDSTNKAASTAFVTGAVGAVAATQVAAAIHAATSKTTPVDADEFGIADSAASWGLKKLTFANLKAWIGGLFVSKSGDTINGNLSFSGTGRRITGDFSNATVANRLMFQSSTLNDSTVVQTLPNGSGLVSGFAAISTSDPANTSRIVLAISQTHASIESQAVGAGSFVPLGFYTVGAERLRIDTSGNVLVTGGSGLGYGIGAGGNVVQATSKSTAVTLNKPSGQITMHNAPLAAGGTVAFQLANSLLMTTDGLVINCIGGLSSLANYRFSYGVTATGIASIYVTNQTGGSLSEAIILNFQIIKGAIS